MSTKHSHGLLKSPYKVVNSYENEFVADWNRNTAEAVAKLLHYIASATASAIKQYSPEEVIEDSIEKGRPKKTFTIGDTFTRHGITYRCTGFSANTGRPTWSKVDKVGKKVQIWQMDPVIDKFKTTQECQDYVMKLGYLSYSSDITTADLKTAKLVCSAMVHLHDFIPYERIKVRMKKIRGATMQASNGEWIEINSDYFTNFDPVKYHKRVNEKYVDDNKVALAKVNNNINALLQRNMDVSKLVKTRNELERLVKGCKRWTYGEQETLAADIFLHEMGHILNAQCSGACGHWKTFTYQTNHTLKEQALHKQLNDERDKLFRKYKKEKIIISAYSNTKPAEFFAETFVAWLHKDKQLPKYINDYFDKYFKETTPKR